MKQILRTIILLVVLLICVTPALSQGYSINMGSSSATGDGTIINPGLNIGIVIQLSGTWAGEVTFKRTTNGTDYTPVLALNLETYATATTATTNGEYCIYVGGAVGVKAEMTTFTSGTLVRRGTLTSQVARSYSSGGGEGGSGDVVGSASSTDNAVARFNGTNGKVIQNSVVTIADTSGNIAGVGTLNGHAIPSGVADFAVATDKLSVFAATSSAELAGVLSDESGSGGGFVRATAPAITGGTHVALTGLGVRSTGSGAFDLQIVNSENLSANRALTIVTGDAARSLTIGASASVSGTNTGDQTTISGNAGTATALQTGRTINGTTFDGTSNITVTAAAGTLTGTTLNATVVSTSITSVGTIVTGVWNGTDVALANIAPSSAASKLLGRGDSGAGDFQEITIGSGLTMTGTTLSASGAGANTALSNLSAVAINAALMPASDNAIALNDNSHRYTDGYFSNSVMVSNMSLNGAGLVGSSNQYRFGSGQEMLMASDFIYNWTSTTNWQGTRDVGFLRSAANTIKITDGSSGFGNVSLGKLIIDSTIITGGTTGDQTINKSHFSVNFAAAGTSLVVTNSFIAATDSIICTIQTNDTTLKSVQAVPASGSVTLFANAAATAETRCNCIVVK